AVGREPSAILVCAGREEGVHLAISEGEKPDVEALSLTRLGPEGERLRIRGPAEGSGRIPAREKLLLLTGPARVLEEETPGASTDIHRIGDLLAIRRPDGRDLVPDAEGEPRAHAALRVDHPKIQAAIRSLNHGDDPLTVRRDLEASERRCLTNRPDPLAFPVEPGELTILATAGLVHEQAGSCKRESAGGASRVELHALGDWRRLTDGPQ